MIDKCSIDRSTLILRISAKLDSPNFDWMLGIPLYCTCRGLARGQNSYSPYHRKTTVFIRFALTENISTLYSRCERDIHECAAKRGNKDGTGSFDNVLPKPLSLGNTCIFFTFNATFRYRVSRST